MLASRSEVKSPYLYLATLNSRSGIWPVRSLNARRLPEDQIMYCQLHKMRNQLEHQTLAKA